MSLQLRFSLNLKSENSKLICNSLPNVFYISCYCEIFYLNDSNRGLGYAQV